MALDDELHQIDGKALFEDYVETLLHGTRNQGGEWEDEVDEIEIAFPGFYEFMLRNEQWLESGPHRSEKRAMTAGANAVLMGLAKYAVRHSGQPGLHIVENPDTTD